MFSTVLHGIRECFWMGAVLLGVAIVAGCGAGEGTTAANPPAASPSQQSDVTRGSLQFSVKFPTKTRTAAAVKEHKRGVSPADGYDGSIPLGSHAIKITLTNPTTGAEISPERVISDTTRPDGVTGTVLVGYPLLPVGSVKVSISAYPDVAATGNPLAIGTDTATIIANETVGASVLMTLTIKSFTVTPPTQILHTLQMPFQTGMVDAQATDAQGRPLLYPLEYFTDNPTAADITAVSTDFMHATITPKISVEGQTGVPVRVTAVEPNSGMSGTVLVILVP